MDGRPSHPRMTVSSGSARGGGRALRQPQRGQRAADASVPASRLASTELQQEVAEQLLVLGALLSTCLDMAEILQTRPSIALC